MLLSHFHLSHDMEILRGLGAQAFGGAGPEAVAGVCEGHSADGWGMVQKVQIIIIGRIGAAGSHTDKPASNAKNREQNRSRLEGKHPLSLHEPSLPSQGPFLAESPVSAGEEL